MSRRSPVLLVLVGIGSVQLGAAIAKTLFDDVSPTAIVWLRLVTSAVVLLAVARPRLTGHTRADWVLVAGFGLSLAVMNYSIYQAFDRIPLGLAVALELSGPLALAVVGSRRAREFAWAGLAALGVALLGLDGGDLKLSGVLFALLAGAAWAAYILLSARTGRRWPGLDGLAVASTAAAALISVVVLLPDAGAPARGGTNGLAGLDPRIVGLGIAVGLLSSVVPYSCELVALRTLRPATFGVLMSLEPAAAALAGLLVVGETLSGPQWLAVACVIAASAGTTRSANGRPVLDGDGSDAPVVLAQPAPD